MLGKMEIRTPPGSRPRDGRHCDLCGCSQPAVRCDKCGCQIFCLSCDDMYHRHPKRRYHLRKAVDPIPAVPQARPVLPIKVSQLTTNPADPSKMPLPPPRKKKSLFGSFRKASPSSDNSPPLPKKEYSWSDRLGSIKKFMSNRPLPPLPNTDDNDMETQPTTNGQSPRGDLSFIHKRSEERPPQLPQRSPRSPDFPGVNQEKENRIPSSPSHMAGQIRNGSLEQNGNHMNQNHEFPNNEENLWNNRMNNQNGPQAFGTLNRQNPQRGFMPPGAPGYPGGMHQSSSATDLHKLQSSEGLPGAGGVPPHFPHYPMNPHMPPHYPYPMYPQYPNYPQYFGNSFANLSNPPTSEGDFSDSEPTSRHSSKKHPFRKRAKRSQSVMIDRMAYPGQFFPFGPYPGYGPWGAPMPMEAPPSPASSIRSLNRAGRTRRRKKMTSEDDDEDLSETSSPMSRPKSSSSDPKEHPRAPLATQTTSSEDESDDNARNRRNKINTIRRQSESLRLPSPPMEHKRVAKLKKSPSKQSDSDSQEIPEVRNERRPSDSTMEQHQSVRQSPLPQHPTAAPSPLPQHPAVRQSPTLQQQPVRQSPVQQSSQEKPSSSTASGQPDMWECRHCTFINPISNRICQVCCKTAGSRTETPVSGHSRPTSSAASNRKGSVGSEKECSSPEKAAAESEDSIKERQDMASLNSALDEAEKQISKGLEELMKLKDDIDASMPKEKSKTFENQSKPENEGSSKPVYKSTGKMRTSILDKLNLNKPQTSNASVSTSTETQTGQNNWTSDKIVEARRHSNSSTTSDAYNSPMAQSPELERAFLGNKQKRDSSCQTQQDSIAEYLEKRKAAEEAFLGRPINNFGFGYGDRMDMVTSPVPSMYDRFYGGGYGMMQRSHSRASLFTGRMNDLGPMEYGPGFGYGPAPMYRSVSRGSLTGDYPDGRISEFHNMRKPDFYLSMEELVERRRQDNIRAQGLELVRMIREAEQQGFNADDIQVALTHCGKQNPMEWLQENWRNMVDSVVTLSTNYGNDKKENDIGLLSENESRDALRLHKGNIWAAVTECVEGRQRKYLELSARGNFSRQDIVDALTSSDGDVEMAYAKLTKSSGKPFLMRIWGQGEGVQNQDGAQPLPEDFNTGPRRNLKDETFNSDEFSDELWSEEGDGVEWDEEEEYDEERGDIEDLRTCQEDLQTSPQEMMTPESEKSDYCDAFSIDDRNMSSPSDDIFFVIPEAKPEKKKGFLSKLAAFRRDSKEQADTVSNVSKDDLPPEPIVQAKEDSISQKSSSSSEQAKSSGALNVLKNTLSAIKDTVTGGAKIEKKAPCAQPERRTIIVRGQIDHELLNSGTKDSVQLTSVKPLDDYSTVTKHEIQCKETAQEDSLPEITPEKVDANKDLQVSQNKENRIPIDKNNSEKLSKPTEFKKSDSNKPQSLAERLKIAKQTRSSTDSPSTSGIKKESSISDSAAKRAEARCNKEEQLQNKENLNSKHNTEKEEGKIETKSNEIQKVKSLEKPKPSEVVADSVKSGSPFAEKGIYTEGKSQKDVKDTKASPVPGSSVSPSPVLQNESKPANKVKSSKRDTESSKIQKTGNLETSQAKETETISKSKAEEIVGKNTISETKHQNETLPPELSRATKVYGSNSSTSLIKKNDKSITNEISDAIKKDDAAKANISKVTSAASDVSSDAKLAHHQEKPKNIETSINEVNATSPIAEDITETLHSNESKETSKEELTSKIKENANKSIQEQEKMAKQEAKIDTSAIPTTSKDAMDTVLEESKKLKSELNSISTENLDIKNSKPFIKTESIISQTISVDENTLSNKDQNNSTSKENMKNESELSIEYSKIPDTSSTEQGHNTNELEPSMTLQKDSSKIDTLNEIQSSLPKTSVEVTSEIMAPNQLNEKLPNKSTTLSDQAVSEKSIERPIVDGLESQSESDKKTKMEIPLETPPEFSAPDQINEEQKVGEEKVAITNEPIEASPQTSAQSDQVLPERHPDITSDQLKISSENTQNTDVLSNANTDKTSVIQPGTNKDPAVSSTNDDLKSIKPKTTKTGKLKKSKSQDKDKKELKSKDIEKTESLVSPETSNNNSSNIASENKSSANHDDVSLKHEIAPPSEVINGNQELTSHANEKISDEKGLEIVTKSDNKTLDSDSKHSENDAIKTEEENKLKNLGCVSTPENASGSSSEPIQNTHISSEFQNSLLSSNVTIPSTSAEVQRIADGKEVQNETKIEQTPINSKGINEKSSGVTNESVSGETELQAPVFSKEFPDTKSNGTSDVPTPSKFTDSSTKATSDASDSSETIPTSVDKSIPENFKSIEIPSSTNTANDSKTVTSSSDSNVINTSEIIAASSSTSGSSEIATASSNTNIPEKTTTDSLGTSISSTSKTVTASSNSNILDNSNATTGTSSANISDNSKTATASTNSNILDNSNATTNISNANISDNSKAIKIVSNSDINDNSKSTTASSSANSPDGSVLKQMSTSKNILDNSKTAPSLSNINIPHSSKTVPVSPSTTLPGTSKLFTASSSGTSKAVTGENSTAKDTKSVIPERKEQHSKVQDKVVTDTSTSDSNKPHSLASTVSSAQSSALQRTVSLDDSEPLSLDSDDTDIEYSDDSRSNSVVPPSPVDALRNRFEGLSGGPTVRPASPFRRMSFNSRKIVIAMEKKRDTSADKPWYHKKIVPEPAKITPPKRSIKQQLEVERKVRKMVADRKCRTYKKAEIVVQLMDMNFEEEEAIQAANECSTLEQAISYLQQECLLCAGYYPVSQIVSMTHCEHRACRECIRAYFTVQIRDRTILDLLCPFCNEPDIRDEDIASDYFNHLDIMLKKLVDLEIHELFQRKLRDRVLMKDPNFRWCSQCSSGFIAMPNLKRLICPDCNAVTCASCRRLWEKEHQGISCEAFAALKDSSDPEAQAAGLAKMLTEDGISCPSCHFRYALAKGGCMHFRCIQCQHDFCSGCSRPFKMGQKCGVSEFCAKLGLHAHHPRNCLFYLRDKEPEDLQKLLEMNDIKYNKEAPEGVEFKGTCQVMEQKETSDGMVDDYCGKDVQEGYAGLCRIHYVEYLGQLVNKHKVDPIQIFDNDDLELVLRRASIRLPPKRFRETDLQYKDKLINLIHEELPLDKMDGS